MFRRAGQILRQEGLRALLKRLWRLIYSYSSYNIYESTLNPSQIVCAVDDITIRIVTSPEDVEQVASDRLAAEGFLRQSLARRL